MKKNINIKKSSITSLFNDLNTYTFQEFASKLYNFVCENSIENVEMEINENNTQIRFKFKFNEEDYLYTEWQSLLVSVDEIQPIINNINQQISTFETNINNQITTFETNINNQITTFENNVNNIIETNINNIKLYYYEICIILTRHFKNYKFYVYGISNYNNINDKRSLINYLSESKFKVLNIMYETENNDDELLTNANIEVVSNTLYLKCKSTIFNVDKLIVDDIKYSENEFTIDYIYYENLFKENEERY